MKRLTAWLIGPLMLSTIAIAAVPASAATARPAVNPKGVPGNYTLYQKIGKKGYINFSMTLRADHTGTDHVNDTIIWKKSGKDITMTFDDGLWTFLGTKTKAGLSSLANPGTMSNINGGHGTWYAVKLPS
jgi:hypothetical protein